MFNVLFCIVALIVMIGFIVTIVNGIIQWNKNNHSPVLNVHAVVASHRLSESTHMTADNMMMTDTTYYVTFRFDSGDTSEFHVSHNEYYKLTDGDSGTLYFQGTRYLQFS